MIDVISPAISSDSSVAPPASEKAIAELEALGLNRLPAQISPIAKNDAVKRLADRLTDLYGFSTAGAMAIAGSVVDPSVLRARIEHTIPLRVPGGTLMVLPAEAWSLRLVIDCTNPRTAALQNYQFGWRAGSHETDAPIRQPEALKDRCELKVTVKDRAHLTNALAQMQASIRTINPSVMDSVPHQGVMVPIILAVMHFEHQKTNEIRCALSSIDGSSRLTAAQTSAAGGDMQISASDPFYRFSEGRDFSQLNKRVRTEYESLEPSRFSEQETLLKRNRCMTVPTYIIVQYKPDPLPGSPDLATAIQGLRGVCHVAPPTPWDDAGQRDAMSDGVISQLHSNQLVKDDMASFIAGAILPDEARTRGLSPYLDVRAACIMRIFSMPVGFDRKMHKAVAHGIKAIRAGSARVNHALRCQVAAELIIRPIRAWFGPSYINTVRSALERALECDHFKDGSWNISGHEPDDLLDKALDELSQSGQPGPFACEMAVMGTFWLCATKNVTRAKAQQGANLPWLEPKGMIEKLVRTEWGLRVIHRAIVDGRKFTPLPNNPNGSAVAIVDTVLAVDDAGNSVMDPTGANRKMSSAWIRSEVLKESAGSNDQTERSPDQIYAQLWSRIVSGITEIKENLNALEEVKNELGQRLVETQGILASDGLAQAQLLNTIAMRIGAHAMRNEMAAKDLQESMSQSAKESRNYTGAGEAAEDE